MRRRIQMLLIKMLTVMKITSTKHMHVVNQTLENYYVSFRELLVRLKCFGYFYKIIFVPCTLLKQYICVYVDHSFIPINVELTFLMSFSLRFGNSCVHEERGLVCMYSNKSIEIVLELFLCSYLGFKIGTTI
jgi:hypothetical protein